MYIAAHVIRHSLKNYKQRSYESLLGWNCIQFFPNDSPYGSFVWSFTFPTSLPPAEITHEPFPKLQQGGGLLGPCWLWQAGERRGSQRRCRAHPRLAAQLPALRSRRGSGAPVPRDTSPATPTTSAHFEQVRKAISATPPTRMVISHKVGEEMCLGSYTS